MSRILKTFAIGLLATLAGGLLTAPTSPGAHFISEAGVTTLDATEVEQLKVITNLGTYECTENKYEATVIGTTATSLTVLPVYPKCWIGKPTHPAAEVNATVTVNGCHYIFTFDTSATAHETLHLSCPPGKAMVVHVSGCTITTDPQALGNHTTSGVKYETGGTVGKTHDLVLNFTIKSIQLTRHGACQIFGTNGTMEMTGKLTVSGTDSNGNHVGITAT